MYITDPTLALESSIGIIPDTSTGTIQIIVMILKQPYLANLRRSNLQKYFFKVVSSEIENLCNTAGTLYVDTSFPTSDKSLFPTNTDPSGQQASSHNNKSIVWQRPKDFPGTKPYQLYEGMIEPCDIKQGALGNCWFMCAVACIAEFPILVKNIFMQEENVNAYGVYRLRLHKNGQWQQVIVDDQVPCIQNSGPVYSHNHEEELWVVLLEKAYAKLHGSYATLVAGTPFEALMDLTGNFGTLIDIYN